MEKAKSIFKTKLLRPAKVDAKDPWTFLILPKKASDILPRRGRTTVQGKINGESFQVTLEPDGQLSHWMRVDEKLRKAAGVEVGDMVTIEISPVEQEPDPEVPDDLRQALNQIPEAKTGWGKATTIARLDWVHWIESAKQSKTREKRIAVACDKLAAGKLRVCCFDYSGFYDKSMSAPKTAD